MRRPTSSACRPLCVQRRSASVRGRLGCDGRPGSGGPRPTGLAPLEVGLDRKRTGRLLEQAGGVRRAPASGRPPAWYEAAVIPIGQTTAYVIESRRRIGLDANACSTGVLVYRIDSGISTGHGPIQVVDATPADSSTPRCRDLDIATFGKNLRPATFRDGAAGVTIKVVRRVGSLDVVRVRIAGPLT